MKKVRIISLFLAIILIFSGISLPAAAADSGLSVTSGCHSVDAAMTLSEEQKMAETAKAVVLYELNSGTMLYTWNPDERIYPTSMVKMMTTLVALENGNLDDVVTVTRKVLNQVPIGIVSANLKSGEEITLRDLLYCTMVGSANDAAAVVANHVAGSAEAFIQMMNDKASQLGCKGTQYTNVHGLHDAGTYTTARDICRITEAALENETFRTMFQTASYTVPETNKSPAREVETTNYMMSDWGKGKYFDKRVTGGKTGATDEGGRCLTLTAQLDGMDLLCVLMGAKPTMAENGSIDKFGSFEESKVMLDYAFANFAFRQVFFDGQSLTQYPVAEGASHVVTQAAASVSTVVPVNLDEAQLKWVYEGQSTGIQAPVEKGQKLGTAQVWYGAKCLAQTDMVSMHGVEKYQSPVVPEKPDARHSGSWLMLLAVLLGLAVLGFLVLLGIRAMRIMKYQRRQKRRSRRR